jgi:hypothetical protein
VIVVVPLALREAINAEIDRALAGRPIDHEERRIVYRRLLTIYNDTGKIPSITLRDKHA